VAGVAAAHDVAFVCVPAGTRSHLGLDRDDVVAALDAFGAAVERRIDLGLVDDQVFVNNATMGLYAKIVQSPAYRDHKVDTALELLPGLLGPHAAPFDLRFVGPDGTEHHSAHLILVANNRYELSHPEGFGSRRRLDAGTLGIVAARLQSPGEAARFAQLQASGPTRRPADWLEWTDTSFQVRSGHPSRSASTGKRCCWTHRSGSGSSRGRCGYGSHPRRPATRPPPPCQPRAGPPSPRCGRRPPANR
jgi:diacylglycerol kinase family enzyme